jgi:hypothetical protein
MEGWSAEARAELYPETTSVGYSPIGLDITGSLEAVMPLKALGEAVLHLLVARLHEGDGLRR